MARVISSYVLALVAASSVVMAQESSRPATYSGTFADERIRLELKSQNGVAYTGTITSVELAQFFGPVFKSSGDSQKTLCGGDEAMVESYEGSANGQKLTCRVLYVKRKDVAIAVMGIGSAAGFKDFGRAIEIVAQSITFKESALEPGLVGTWTLENYSSAGGGGAGTKTNVS